MSDDKLVTLVRRLRSRGGNVKWDKTEEDGTYETEFSGYALQIAELEEEDQDPIYQIRIFDGEGVLLDEFTDEDLTEIMNLTAPTEPSVMFAMMQDVYRGARRSALGVDKAIDVILGALGG